MLEHWTEAGLPPSEFWDQTVPTFNAAMRGAIRARQSDVEVRRELALLTAYYGGYLAQYSWKDGGIPSTFQAWRDKLLAPPRRASSTELIAFFDGLAARGLATAH